MNLKSTKGLVITAALSVLTVTGVISLSSHTEPAECGSEATCQPAQCQTAEAAQSTCQPAACQTAEHKATAGACGTTKAQCQPTTSASTSAEATTVANTTAGSCGGHQTLQPQFSLSHGHCSYPFQGELESFAISMPGGATDQATLDFSVNTNSFNCEGDHSRADRLRTADMFGVQCGGSSIAFKTNDTFNLEEDSFQFRGEVTIKGETRPAILDAQVVREGEDVIVLVKGNIELEQFEGIEANDIDVVLAHGLSFSCAFPVKDFAKSLAAGC